MTAWMGLGAYCDTDLGMQRMRNLHDAIGIKLLHRVGRPSKSEGLRP